MAPLFKEASVANSLLEKSTAKSETIRGAKQLSNTITTTCRARRKAILCLLVDDRPGDILTNTPQKGTGKGKAGDAETVVLWGICSIERRNTENEVLVLRTEMVKNEHPKKKVHSEMGEIHRHCNEVQNPPLLYVQATYLNAYLRQVHHC